MVWSLAGTLLLSWTSKGGRAREAAELSPCCWAPAPSILSWHVQWSEMMEAGIQQCPRGRRFSCSDLRADRYVCVEICLLYKRNMSISCSVHTGLWFLEGCPEKNAAHGSLGCLESMPISSFVEGVHPSLPTPHSLKQTVLFVWRHVYRKALEIPKDRYCN